MEKLANFINGSYVPPQSGAYLDSYCPATGTVIHQVPESNAADVEAAVAAAQAALPAWSTQTDQARADVLNRIADGLEKHADAFAHAESMDQGKPVNLAASVDIPRAITNFRFFAGAILHHNEEAHHNLGRLLNYTTRTPIGVCGLISPWNLPLYLLTWKIAPAIATGNTCVCKPSEITSLTAHMLGEVLNEAGVPPGVVNLVFGTGTQSGKALVAHPDVPLISFTGGTATAEHIIKDSAPHFKKLGLELGGKNPNIVFEDAHLDNAIAHSIRASFANQGEICLCGSRLFVQSSIFDDFVSRFTQEAKKLVVGDPKDPATHLGALVSKAHRDKVKGYMDLARELGGNILLGGDAPELPGKLAGGYFLNPTIVTGLPYDCRINTEEIFGPVVSITPFENEQEVIGFANSVKYGLAASLFTEDVTRAHRVAQQIDAGTVWVNCWMVRDIRVPFGGMKASGVGREGGNHSIDFYTEQKNICINLERS